MEEIEEGLEGDSRLRKEYQSHEVVDCINWAWKREKGKHFESWHRHVGVCEI